MGKVCSIVYQMQGCGFEFSVGIAYMWFFLCVIFRVDKSLRLSVLHTRSPYRLKKKKKEKNVILERGSWGRVTDVKSSYNSRQ